jgi:arabinose-5-phosphate isomerase
MTLARSARVRLSFVKDDAMSGAAAQSAVSHVAPLAGSLSSFEQLRLGREIVRAEAQALVALADSLGEEFCLAARLLADCRGSVIVSGMGKAGVVGQKIAATLASTGTRSHFVHPAEAIHGDLGRLSADDVVLMLSYSGHTEEITRLLVPLAEMGVPLVAMTGRLDSPLACAAQVTLHLGSIREACPLGLAPSTSTTAMLALGDALALVVSRMKHFTADDFARFHPGGSLGLKLALVEQAMRPVADCRVAHVGQSVRAALIAESRPGRRTGAIMVVDDAERLAGIFTDSDLARLLERKRDDAIDGPIAAVMTASPTTVTVGTRLAEACEILAAKKISELPVVDPTHKPVGLIDITDLVGIDRTDVQRPRSKVPSRLRVLKPDP